MDASACRNNWLKYMTLSWPLDLQNPTSSSVAWTTSSTKVPWNSVHWVRDTMLAGCKPGRTHACTGARTTDTHTYVQTTWKHNASASPIGSGDIKIASDEVCLCTTCWQQIYNNLSSCCRSHLEQSASIHHVPPLCLFSEDAWRLFFSGVPFLDWLP